MKEISRARNADLAGCVPRRTAGMIIRKRVGIIKQNRHRQPFSLRGLVGFHLAFSNDAGSISAGYIRTRPCGPLELKARFFFFEPFPENSLHRLFFTFC
jgi:hypothetical protein